MLNEADFYRQRATLNSVAIDDGTGFYEEQARRDFIAFRWYLTADNLRHRTYPYMLEWIKALNTEQDSPNLHRVAGKNTLILAPRGFAKSTLAVQWLAWVIGIHTQMGIPIKILYCCFVADIALAKSLQVKRIIESHRYQRVFPWVRKSSRWADGLWQIDMKLAGIPDIGEPYTFACAGLTGAVASRRSNLCLLDDLIKSPQAIKNPEVRKEMRDNWHGVVKPTIYDGGRAICLGTRMRADDIYSTTFIPPSWQQIVGSAIQADDRGNERSLCEKLFRLETLQKNRIEDPVSFSFQMQNVVMTSEEDDYLEEDLIKYGKPPDLRQFDQLAVACDLATSERQKSDYTFMTLLGRIDKDVWALDCRMGRPSGNIDKCDMLLLLLFDWGLIHSHTEWNINPKTKRIDWESKPPRWEYTGFYVDFYPEDVGYQRSLKADYEFYVEDTLGVRNVFCVPQKVPGDKRQKFKSITGVFQLERFYFNKYRKFTALIEQLTLPSAYDDGVDSLALGLRGLGLSGTWEMD